MWSGVSRIIPLARECLSSVSLRKIRRHLNGYPLGFPAPNKGLLLGSIIRLHPVIPFGRVGLSP